MPSNDAEALAELGRLCTEARASLPAAGHHRLRVLLDMILVDLAREGCLSEQQAVPVESRKRDASTAREAP